MAITAAVLTNPNNISKENIRRNEKVVDILEKILIEQNEKLNDEFRKIQERINNVKLISSLNNCSKQETKRGYHGPRKYFGLESIIEVCNDSLFPITELDKLYLDKLYLYIECANANKILGIKKNRKPIYSKATRDRKKEENDRIEEMVEEKKERCQFINEQLNEEIDMITLEDIINIDSDIYYFSKKQMSKNFKMLISEIVELIENSKMSELIIEDRQGNHYLPIDDNYEEAFFCLKKITYIMAKAIEHIQSESVKEKQKRLEFQEKRNKIGE